MATAETKPRKTVRFGPDTDATDHHMAQTRYYNKDSPSTHLHKAPSCGKNLCEPRESSPSTGGTEDPGNAENLENTEDDANDEDMVVEHGAHDPAAPTKSDNVSPITTSEENSHKESPCAVAANEASATCHDKGTRDDAESADVSEVGGEGAYTAEDPAVQNHEKVTTEVATATGEEQEHEQETPHEQEHEQDTQQEQEHEQETQQEQETQPQYEDEQTESSGDAHHTSSTSAEDCPSEDSKEVVADTSATDRGSGHTGAPIQKHLVDACHEADADADARGHTASASEGPSDGAPLPHGDEADSECADQAPSPVLTSTARATATATATASSGKAEADDSIVTKPVRSEVGQPDTTDVHQHDQEAVQVLAELKRSVTHTTDLPSTNLTSTPSDTLHDSESTQLPDSSERTSPAPASVPRPTHVTPELFHTPERSQRTRGRPDIDAHRQDAPWIHKIRSRTKPQIQQSLEQYTRLGKAYTRGGAASCVPDAAHDAPREGCADEERVCEEPHMQRDSASTHKAHIRSRSKTMRKRNVQTSDSEELVTKKKRKTGAQRGRKRKSEEQATETRKGTKKKRKTTTKRKATKTRKASKRGHSRSEKGKKHKKRKAKRHSSSKRESGKKKRKTSRALDSPHHSGGRASRTADRASSAANRSPLGENTDVTREDADADADADAAVRVAYFINGQFTCSIRVPKILATRTADELVRDGALFSGHFAASKDSMPVYRLAFCTFPNTQTPHTVVNGSSIRDGAAASSTSDTPSRTWLDRSYTGENTRFWQNVLSAQRLSHVEVHVHMPAIHSTPDYTICDVPIRNRLVRFYPDRQLHFHTPWIGSRHVLLFFNKDMNYKGSRACARSYRLLQADSGAGKAQRSGAIETEKPKSNPALKAARKTLVRLLEDTPFPNEMTDGQVPRGAVMRRVTSHEHSTEPGPCPATIRFGAVQSRGNRETRQRRGHNTRFELSGNNERYKCLHAALLAYCHALHRGLYSPDDPSAEYHACMITKQFGETEWVRSNSEYLGPCAIISLGNHKGGKLLVKQDGDSE